LDSLAVGFVVGDVVEGEGVESEGVEVDGRGLGE
jgi:hypothetical protein